MKGTGIMTFYNAKKVFVTGLSGLIGKELISPLKDAGFEIYAVTRNKDNLAQDVNWLFGDLFDENFIKESFEQVKPEYLLNMAWITTGDYLKSDINYDFLNAGINLIKYFSKNGGKRAVFAGTCFEYQFKDEALKEDDVLDCNKTVYTFCKNKLREITDYYCKMNDISFGWGRIFYVFGKNEDKTRLGGMIMDKLAKNEQITIKTPDLVKDYMYTKDIAGAFVKFLQSDIKGCVNICSSKPITVKDFVLEFAKMVDKENLVIFENQKNSQPKIIVGNNDRLIKEVGFKPGFSINQAVNEILG